MDIIEDKEKVTICFDERIDTVNAPQVEKELFDIIGRYLDQTFVFDAKNLTYISSAGLRILLRVAKKTKTRVRIYNVQSLVYETFEVTGFVDLLDIEMNEAE